jgi:hypothetical protein
MNCSGAHANDVDEYPAIKVRGCGMSDYQALGSLRVRTTSGVRMFTIFAGKPLFIAHLLRKYPSCNLDSLQA